MDGDGFLPMHSGCTTISNFFNQGCRDDVDAKVFWFLYACGISFNVHPIGMRWYNPSMVPLKDTKALGNTKPGPWDLIRKEPKAIKSDWTKYGVYIVSYGWTNVESGTLINILGVSASGVFFLSSHDYLDH